MKRLELDILYVATRAAILLLLPLFISDVSTYQEYARNLISDGKIPYLQWDFEYPPLAFLLMALPAWIHTHSGLHDTESFRLLFGIFLLPFDFMLYTRFRRSPPFRGATFAFIFLTSSMFLLLFDRFDIVVGFLIALPFLGKRSEADLRYAVSWGLGGALKLVPLVLAPTRILDWEGTAREKFRRLLRFGAVVSLPIAISCAAAAALSHGKISFLSHHNDRGVQIESLVGSLLMTAQAFTHFVNVTVESNFGAQHLSKIAGVVTASRVLFYGVLAFSYMLLAFGRRRWDSLSASWLLISGLVTFGYVLSPQFLLWLIPIGLCAAARVPAGLQRSLWLVIFSATVILTGVHFRFYWDYVNLHHLSVLLVLGRNFLLVALWGLSWAWMRQPKVTGFNALAANG